MHRTTNEHVPIDGYILIQAHAGNEVSRLVERVTQIPGVVRAESVHGAYDLIAEVRDARDPRIRSAARAIGELDGVLRAIPLGLVSRAAVPAGSDGRAA